MPALGRIFLAAAVQPWIRRTTDEDNSQTYTMPVRQQRHCPSGRCRVQTCTAGRNNLDMIYVDKMYFNSAVRGSEVRSRVRFARPRNAISTNAAGSSEPAAFFLDCQSPKEVYLQYVFHVLHHVNTLRFPLWLGFLIRRTNDTGSPDRGRESMKCLAAVAVVFALSVCSSAIGDLQLPVAQWAETGLPKCPAARPVPHPQAPSLPSSAMRPDSGRRNRCRASTTATVRTVTVSDAFLYNYGDGRWANAGGVGSDSGTSNQSVQVRPESRFRRVPRSTWPSCGSIIPAAMPAAAAWA